MKKQLPTDAIANELSGASVFFGKPSASPTVDTPDPPTITIESQPAPMQQSEKGNSYENAESSQPQIESTMARPALKQTDETIASHHATMPPNNQVIPVAHHQEPEHTIPHAPMLPVSLETIRKTVRQVGKEAATYRLTEEEKQQLVDIVYTYKRRGYRTSDNELARIAINWLILDYQEEGEQSVLARVLEALHR